MTARLRSLDIPESVYAKADRMPKLPPSKFLNSIRSHIPNPPSRKRSALILAFLFLFYLLYPSRPVPKPSHFHKILSGSGFAAAGVDRAIGLHRGGNKAKVLESFSNPYGFINLVDPYAGGVFNPSILVLPDTVGDGFRHLLVARGPERYEVIDHEDTRWESVVG